MFAYDCCVPVALQILSHMDIYLDANVVTREKSEKVEFVYFRSIVISEVVTVTIFCQPQTSEPQRTLTSILRDQGFSLRLATDLFTTDLYLMPLHFIFCTSLVGKRFSFGWKKEVFI